MAQSVDRQARDVAAVFDRASATYEGVGVPWFGPINERLVQVLGPAPGDRVLDIGCGRGAALFPLARAVGESGRVTGIDLAPGMIAATRRDAEEAGLRNVDLHVMDASAPDLPPSTFDVVVASLVLFFLPDPAAALVNWKWLLRPGGRLVVSSFRERPESWAALDEVIQPHVPAPADEVQDDSEESSSDPPENPFATDAGVERLLDAAGFLDVHTVGFEVTTHFTDVDQWFRWQWSHGGRALWERIPESAYDDIKHGAEAVLDQCRDDSGRITLTQGVRLTLGSRPAS